MQKGRIRQPTISQQTRCKTFSDCARGSDPWRGWNTAECKCAMEVLMASASTKGLAEQNMHLNPNKTQKISRNTLRDFLLRSFSKKLSWFRCSGKGEHLNLATRQNPAANPLTTNTLQDFQRLYPWFRSLAGLEHRRMQIRPGGTSGRGIHQTRNRVLQASEPEQNPRNSPQFIETLPIAKFHQASPLVQMQRKMGASEPCHKTESGSQPTHSKRIARLSATVPVVQILGGAGMPRNANVPWRHFWQGFPPNTQQNSTCI